MQGLSSMLRSLRAFPARERPKVLRTLVAQRLLRGIGDDLRREIVCGHALRAAGGSIRFGSTETEVVWTPSGTGREVRLKLRRGTSDIRVFRQIALEDEYEALVDAIRETCPDLEHPVILDAGANIGLASVALAVRIPRARLVAVEPEPANFGRMKAHLADNGLLERVLPVEGALWTKTTRLDLRHDFRDGEAWACRTVPADPGAGDGPGVEAFTCEDLLARAGEARFDILKIDVEGAERDLLQDGRFVRDHLARARCVALEVHPEFIQERTVMRILGRHGFTTRRSGEYLVARRP